MIFSEITGDKFKQFLICHSDIWHLLWFPWGSVTRSWCAFLVIKEYKLCSLLPYSEMPFLLKGGNLYNVYMVIVS